MIAKLRTISNWRFPMALALAGFALVLTDARSETDQKLVRMAGTPAADLAVLRVWTCSNYEMESALGVSADGRWLSYASPFTGELMVRDLVKRKDQCVVKVPPAEVWHRMAYGSLVSPDGSRVAYAWQERDKPMQLRVIGRDSKGDRLLYQNKDVSWLAPGCWSADSSKVLAVLTLDKATPSVRLISLLSVRDGSIRVIKTLPRANPSPENVSLDPGGRFLAYDLQPASTAPREVRLLSIQSGEETVVVGGAADNRCLGWSPDGRKILFSSNRRSTTDCWVQRMADGKPQGEPELLKPNLGMVSPLGITRKGGFYYGLDCTSTEVQLAKIDLASGEFVSPPKSLTGKDRGHDSEPRWSPDGKHLAYISAKDDARVLRVRSADTGEERDYSPSIGIFYTPTWSADGKSIRLGARKANESPATYRLDLTTGETQPIKTNEVFAVAITNQTFTFRRDREKQQILAKHRETGQEKVLYQGGTNEALSGMLVSPDGKHVAFSSNLGEGGVWRRMVKLVSADGGEAHELIGGTNYLAGFAWFPDNRRLLCCGDKDTWVLSIDGQPPRKLKACFEGYNLSINCDGQQVAYVKWDFRSELWLMENAVPPPGRVKQPRVQP